MNLQLDDTENVLLVNVGLVQRLLCHNIRDQL